jgi:hypothetical protein
MKMYKNWDKMSEEEKKTEKLAIVILTVLFSIIALLLSIALT